MYLPISIIYKLFNNAMHKKSVLTFVLLLSSLVVLSVISFLNNNNSFSNPVLGQGYDIYRDNAYYSQ